TGVIPSNTGVLLKGDAGEYVFEEAEEPEPIEANLLIGTTKDEGETFNEPGFKYYILANDAENGIGFYFQKDTNGKSALCGQYKAVLVLPEKTDAIGFRLDGATMIEAVEAPADDAVIYDLTGRRVQDATGGIYIVNGKKVLVK
ncbi:MAG: leucine-rich repeat domain-containing protein, partial [Bacteroidaceae bacterium]|nr:leucine-rich repeat domain-containing protein [Bacteroidaceae bacterium]